MPLWKNLYSVIEKIEKYPTIADREANKKRIKFDTTVASNRSDAYLVSDYPVPPDDLKNPIKVGLNNTTGKKGRTAIYWTEDTITENRELLEKIAITINSNIQGNEKPENWRLSIIPMGISPATTRIILIYLDSDETANNFYSYLDSSFCRNLITAGSGSRDRINHKIARFIPDLCDYSNNNPLFMTDQELKEKYNNEDNVYFGTIFENLNIKTKDFIGLDLNERLYKLFDLTEEEIDIIESEPDRL